MANEDKPRGRFGKPGSGGASRSGGRGDAPRSGGFKGAPSAAKPAGEGGETRSRGFKDGPRGEKPAGKSGEIRSRGFKDGPGGGKPAGKSRGFKDRPAAAATGEAGGAAPRAYRPRPAGDKPAGGDKPYRERSQDRGGDKPRAFRERPAREDGDKPRPFRERPPQASGDRPAGSGKPYRERTSDRGGDRPREVRDRTAATAPHDNETPVTVTAEPERIAKYLARAGVASRRDAERMIEDGRITLNGVKIVSPAINITSDDVILVDGEPVPEIERTRLWLYHKPAGLVTTNRDPEGRPTVFENLPKDLPRVLSVGRLDINTEGLLLLTNDGGVARMLELPLTGWLRRYRVRAHGKIEQAKLDELKNGIAVDGVFYGAVEAEIEREQGANIWLTVGLREGKNREVKNILGSLGLDVNRLIRISYGPFQLGELPEGAVQEIRGRTLRDQLGDKLIEKAGANFDAPIRRAFSNKPVRAEEGETRLVQVKKSGDWVSASPVQQDPRRGKKGGGEKRFDRDSALSRLDTKKPERGEARPKRDRPPHAGAGETDKQRHGRSSNVWMAPGARPQGKKPKPRPEGEGGGAPRGAGRPAGPKSGAPRSGGQRPGGSRPGGSRPGGSRPGGPKRKG